MKVIVAMDSYKGCLSSAQANSAVKRGILRVDENIDVVSFLCGDGGEGTMDAFMSACNGERMEVEVQDAYRNKIVSSYGIIENGNTAVIEVGKVIGLTMREKQDRHPMYASSYGVGEMLAHALKKGCKKIILALGGSSTNDGGMGLLEAIGVRFYDENHKCLKAMPKNLEKIAYIDKRKMLDFSNVECIAACDVKNHLLGENGATYVFGPQKGLYPNQLKRVEKGMIHYCERMKKVGYDLNRSEGGGAAGGIGSVFIEVLHAKMMSGVDLLFSYNHIEESIFDCNLVITGEGQSDLQSAYGKLPVGVLNIAKKYHKPCICISGALGVDYKKLYDLGFAGIYSIADRPMNYKKALEVAEEKLEDFSYSIVKTIQTFRGDKL